MATHGLSLFLFFIWEFQCNYSICLSSLVQKSIRICLLFFHEQSKHIIFRIPMLDSYLRDSLMMFFFHYSYISKILCSKEAIHLNISHQFHWRTSIRPPLKQRKNIGIPKNLYSTGYNPMKTFETKDWFLPIPLKFIWNGLL